MSTKDLQGFCADLTEYANEIMPDDHAKFVKVIALDVLKGIVEKTPVDTGLAKGNWQVTNGEPATAPIGTLDKEGGSTITKGQTEIIAAKPMTKIIWISNNLPYAEPLENGHSKQAPIGMVAVTLAVEEAKLMAASV